MTKYEYDTMLVDKNNVDKFTEELKRRVDEGFEVFTTQMVATGSSIHIAYFLRREILDDSRRTSAVLVRILQAQATKVSATARSHTDWAYPAELEKFYEMTTEILGLK